MLVVVGAAVVDVAGGSVVVSRVVADVSVVVDVVLTAADVVVAPASPSLEEHAARTIKTQMPSDVRWRAFIPRKGTGGPGSTLSSRPERRCLAYHREAERKPSRYLASVPRTVSLLAVTVLAVAASACAHAVNGIRIVPEPPLDTTTTRPMVPAAHPLMAIELVEVANGLEDPVSIASTPLLDGLFVVEKPGRIVRITDTDQATVMDITARVGWTDFEQGLLSMAFHPRFPEDPRVFVTYTNLDEDLVLASFEWTGDRFDITSEEQVLLVPQPHKYHQGGYVTFGPHGLLWAAFGDGGGIGDRYKNGQNTETLNGTIVRIDVDEGAPYSVPETNPFVEDGGGAPEIWAWGLRNPWRIAVDNGVVIIADVGQEGADEIDVVPVDEPGHNFGWSVMEGFGCYNAESCETDGFTLPRLVVDREDSCAVIGGPVYRGAAIPELYGHFVWGDYCHGWMHSAPLTAEGLGDEVQWEHFIDRIGNITTFGLDNDGELLVAVLDGQVYRLVPSR